MPSNARLKKLEKKLGLIDSSPTSKVGSKPSKNFEKHDHLKTHALSK
jgi:hypothetical protein